MKKILRIFTVEVAALYISSQIASGIVFENQIEGLIVTGIALAIAMYFVKPVVNILLLPLNLVTLGLFKFLSHAITLYIVDLAMNQFTVSGFHFAGFTSRFFDLPAVNFEQGAIAYIAFSILLSIIAGLLG